MKSNRIIKLEGRALNIDTETLDDQKVLEVGNEIADNAKVEKDDKPNFEDYKTLYKGAIDEKCLATYGTTDDEKLWEDTAKEMFLKTINYVPNENTKLSGELTDKETIKESKRLIKHNKKTESTDCSRQKLDNRNPLTDDEKLKYYYGTYKVGQSIPYEVYKIDDKFYDGNGVEIDNNELKECSRQK